MAAPPPAAVGDRLREARERAGVSWRELAERSGISRATIARIEAGDVEPTRLTVWSLAAVLNVDAGWLAGYTAG